MGLHHRENLVRKRIQLQIKILADDSYSGFVYRVSKKITKGAFQISILFSNNKLSAIFQSILKLKASNFL